MFLDFAVNRHHITAEQIAKAKKNKGRGTPTKTGLQSDSKQYCQECS